MYSHQYSRISFGSWWTVFAFLLDFGGVRCISNFVYFGTFFGMWSKIQPVLHFDRENHQKTKENQQKTHTAYQLSEKAKTKCDQCKGLGSDST